MKEREPNHAISSIDLLPEDATADVAWAILELEKGKRTDSDVLFEFNQKLDEIGYGPISKSSFGRYALKKRKIFGEDAEFSKLNNAFKEILTAENNDDRTSMLIQLGQTALYKLVTQKDLNAKESLDYGRALAAFNAAKRISAAEKTKEKKQVETESVAVFDAAAKAVEAKSSNPAEAKAYLMRIREEVYNIYEKEVDKQPAANDEAHAGETA